MSDEYKSHFELPPFIPIFIGLDEHLRLGKMSLADLGVYLLLHRWCEWRWGIYYGCAATIASLMGGRAEKAEVQRSLQSLRRFEFINYRLGTGLRGSYNILIHKYLPRVGELRGYRLNAFALHSLEQPVYERSNGEGTVDGLSLDGGQTVTRLSSNGERTEDEPLQEEQEFKSIRIQDFKSQRVGRLVGRGPQPAAAAPTPPPVSVGQGRTGRIPDSVEADHPLEPVPKAQTEPPVPVPAEPVDPDHPSQPAPSHSQTERAAPSEPVAGHVVSPASEDAPAKLAVRFFEYQGSPAKYQSHLAVWTERFRVLIQTYGEDLPELMDYAFKADSFWSEKLLRGEDPLGYFEEKLKNSNITEKFQRWKTVMKNRRKTTNSTEVSNGKHINGFSKRGAEKRPVDNRAAAEEVKRRIGLRVRGAS